MKCTVALKYYRRSNLCSALRIPKVCTTSPGSITTGIQMSYIFSWATDLPDIPIRISVNWYSRPLSGLQNNQIITGYQLNNYYAFHVLKKATKYFYTLNHPGNAVGRPTNFVYLLTAIFFNTQKCYELIVFDYSVDLEAQRIQMVAVALPVQIRGKFP